SHRAGPGHAEPSRGEPHRAGPHAAEKPPSGTLPSTPPAKISASAKVTVPPATSRVGADAD
ncbi:MAG TPA: Laminin subunit beta-1, partial [Actinoplanes sp.]|nr:Laminin subunit beta-1 [Actinoplanes sp.]